MPKKKRVSSEQKGQPKLRCTENQSQARVKQGDISSKQGEGSTKTVIFWPLPDHDFRLVCCLCYVAQGKEDGDRTYRPEYQHACSHDLLVIRVKNSPHLSWLQIRNLPPKQDDDIPIQLCKSFQPSHKCHSPACPFPHNRMEMFLWDKEREGIFNLKEFLKEAHDKKIFTSDMPGLVIRSPEVPLRKNVQRPAFEIKTQKYSSGSVERQQINKPRVSNRFVHMRPPHLISRFTNPLESECSLFCSNCLLFSGTAWFYIHNESPTHICLKNILAFRLQDDDGETLWAQVRQRATDFKGNYAFCNSVRSGNPKDCRFPGDCRYAHSEEEKHLWKLEQEERFDISEFINSCRKNTKISRGPTSKPPPNSALYSLLQKYGGQFVFICRRCFCESSCISSAGVRDQTCSGKQKHDWKTSKVLAHFKGTRYTLVDRRKFFHEGAYFQMCKWQKYCRELKSNRCRFSHSYVERSVWTLQQDTGITDVELIEQSALLFNSARRPAWASTPFGQTSPWFNKNDKKTTHYASDSQQGMKKPPINITETCGQCWSKHLHSRQVLGRDRCERGHNNFKILSTFITLPSKREIRALPGHLYPTQKLVLCRCYPKCRRSVCSFPHGSKELEIWQWMLSHEIKNLRDVANLCCSEPKQTRKDFPDLNSPFTERAKETFSGAQNPSTNPVSNEDNLGKTQFPEYYCQFCEISCNNDEEWDEHCLDQSHLKNISSDKEHQWNFRQPPWGKGDHLHLCPRHIHNKSCQFSQVPQMYNLCSYAHSQEELDEWQERLEWRQMKRMAALDRNMISYTESLLQEYHIQGDTVNVIAEHIDDVVIESKENDVIYKSKKNDIFTWTFEIHTKAALEKVALLHNKDRLHFTLVSTSGEQHQIASGDMFLDVDDEDNACYKVNVHFSAGMFGSFSQWVVFDFGSRPVLVKKLCVEIGDQVQQEKVKNLRKELIIERWTSHNREIVYDPEALKYMDPFTQKLLHRYKDPSARKDVVTSHTLTKLNQHNYVHKMHGLLELEEMTRHAIVSRYNLACNVTITQFVDEKGAFFIGQNGDLFMKVTLAEALTSDSLAGQLFISNVKTALLAHTDSTSKKVYEARLVHQGNYEYDGRGKDYVYLVVNAEAAKALCVSPGQNVQLEVQFQMDRTLFCRMHYALDSLSSTQIVFPDLLKFKADVQLLKNMARIGSTFLNEEQLIAVRHIVVQRNGYNPPFIMYGPFGTGKTQTLASATKALLFAQKDQVRILICTQSNSAADLYITKHLHTFCKKNSGFKILRLNAEIRKINTVPPEVLEFCLCMNNMFATPSKEQMMHYQLVLTTVENALILSNLKMHGVFTHIFIDEAGQILECETLIPLSLATSKTCMVLTGDHHQIGPTVYSQEAQSQKFGVSMLDRLFNFYKDIEYCGDKQLSEKCQQSPLTILLKKNYRTRPEILKFISSIFYNGPDNLMACGNIPHSIGTPPLAFFVVQGKESQGHDSTSYLNDAEAHEVVVQVTELLDNWPMEWGPMNPKEVAVIATYSDQIKHIRTLFRKDKSRPHLRNVDVGPIHSFQGKEVTALFITTVRTCNLLKEQHIVCSLEAGEGIGDMGFLSSPKKLNTALTRTQSFVAVIGDPVALCLIGKCAEIWKSYLKYCSNIGSIIPKTYAYDVIAMQAIELQQGPEGRMLDMISKQQQQEASKNIVQKRKTTENPNAAVASNSYDHTGCQEKDAKLESCTKGEESVTLKCEKPTQQESSSIKPKKIKKRLLFNELNLNMATNSEEILSQLAQECLEKCLTNEAIESMVIKIKEISLTLDEEGFVVLTYNHICNKAHSSVENAKKKEGFAEFTLSEDSDKNTKRDILQSLLEAHPTKFFKCTLTVKSQSCAFATLLGPPTVHNFQMHGKDIQIVGYLNRNHALDGDTVVVEILGHNDNGSVQGQVKGIFERVERPDKKLYLCQAGSDDTGVVKPLDKGMPAIYLLNSAPHIPMVRKGHIPVYKFLKEGSIKFSHYEILSSDSHDCRLFVVRYLCWPQSCSLPCGIIVGIIRNDCGLLKGTKVIEVEHNIQHFMSMQAGKEVESFFPEDMSEFVIPSLNRWNLTQNFCFTITDKDRKDIELAISVSQAEDIHEVGLHITDIAAFIDKGSVLDQECECRGASMFPLGKEPQHMLPSHAATGICSLQTGFDRLALSVIIKVDGEGKLCDDPEVFRSVINIKRNLSQNEVEDILLSEESHADYFKSCIIILKQLTSIWRKQRLGNSDVCLDLEPENKLYQHCYTMMNELELQFNGIVANLLLSRFPSTTPLLTQPQPDKEALEKWRSTNARFAINSLCMTKAFLDCEMCHCAKTCTCVLNYMRQHMLQTLKELTVFKKSWLLIAEATKEETQDLDFAQDLIVNPQHLPQVWLSHHKLAQIQKTQTYSCSEDLPGPYDRLHYGYSLPLCTTVTEPITNFISLVVQRLLVAYIDESLSPYTPEEMSNLCRAATRVQQKVSSFHRDMFLLHFCCAIKVKPIAINAVIEAVNNQTLQLNIGPGLNGVPSQYVDLDLLSPEKFAMDCFGLLQLSWRERIYEATDKCRTPQTQAQNFSEIKLNSDHLVFNIPSIPWQRLLQSVRGNDINDLFACVEEISLFVEDEISVKSKNQVEVVSDQEHHFVPFCITLQEGQSLSVQVSSRLCQGRLSPSIQLLHLTPRLAFCLEHKKYPEECFTTCNDDESLAQVAYSDEMQYVRKWLLPALSLETACQAAQKGECVTIHSVCIAWRKEEPTFLTGLFTLTKEFCKRSSFYPDSGKTFASSLLGGNFCYCEDDNFCLDYLCVRYSDLDRAEESGLDKSVAAVLNNSQPITWVCHCLVKDVTESAEGYQVKVAVVQSNMEIPKEFLEMEKISSFCTVEWICKTKEHRIIDIATRGLSNASDFAKDIITGRKPVNSVDPLPLKQRHQVLHLQQEMIVSECLKQPFATVIGGPGTGKSTIVACLAHLLVLLNTEANTLRKGSLPYQLMICGPTEESLDVLTGYLQRLQSITGQIVRVYSEKVENYDFPGLAPNSQDKYQPRFSVMKKMALHHLVRDERTSHGKRLREHERLMSSESHSEFQFLLERAQKHYLQRAKVILCTCITSSRPMLQLATNVRQIIMDDANLIPEMEAIIPLALHKNTNQLLMFGDPKMPSREMASCRASKLGLSRSLLQRYAVGAKKLNIQFRMSNPLISFSSNYFYDGKLETDIKAAPAQTIPMQGESYVLCHIQGEESRIVAPTCGDHCVPISPYENIINKMEIQVVLTMVQTLIRRHGIKESSIMVITATCAQSSEIKQAIPYNIIVCTVIESIGKECPYVILSTVHSIPSKELEGPFSHLVAKEHLRDMANEKMVNLALTRARNAFFIIGNKVLLGSCQPWQALMASCEQHRSVVDAELFLQSLDTC